MQPQVVAALIGGAAGLFTALVATIVGRRKMQAEIKNLNEQTIRLHQENEKAREQPREAERNSYRLLLTNFLEPFDRLLAQNEKIYKELLGDRGALEYHPRFLRSFFESLPYDDRRKLCWYQRIERLREHNRGVLSLLQQYGSHVVTVGFRDACSDFRYHADEWEDVWKAVEVTHIRGRDESGVSEAEPIPGGDIVPAGEERGETLYANRFPENLRKALGDEIAIVRKRASSTLS